MNEAPPPSHVPHLLVTVIVLASLLVLAATAGHMESKDLLPFLAELARTLLRP